MHVAYRQRRRYHRKLTNLSKHLLYPTELGGQRFLLEALAVLFNGHFEPFRAVLPEHAIAGAGATACLTALLTSICDPGDAVLIAGLYWSKS
jgi:aspartate/methionine/tyrosine aminotransferase